MSMANPFDLLGDDDAEDPALLIAAKQPKSEPKKVSGSSSKAAAAGVAKSAAQGKLPSKPIPPTQAVKEAKADSARGGGGRGRGRGSGGYGRERSAGGGSYRDSPPNEPPNESYLKNEKSDSGYASKSDGRKTFDIEQGWFRGYHQPAGGRRGGYNNGEVRDGERPRRQFDRHSATGKSNGIKREGSGQGNWGTNTDELVPVAEDDVVEGEKGSNAEKPSVEEYVPTEEEKEAAKKEAEEKEREAKEMTLEEYEKILEEKRKALQALKTEGRKVDSTEFESMKALSNKKSNDDVFIKLGSDKDKKKELADKEERARKSISINEFLKPAEGERYLGRGRGGRGRGGRGDYGGGRINGSAPSREDLVDPGQFPTLKAK